MHANRSVDLAHSAIYRDKPQSRKLTWHARPPQGFKICNISQYTGIIASITRVDLVYTPIASLTWHISCYTGTITSIARVDFLYMSSHLILYIFGDIQGQSLRSQELTSHALPIKRWLGTFSDVQGQSSAITRVSLIYTAAFTWHISRYTGPSPQSHELLGIHAIKVNSWHIWWYTRRIASVIRVDFACTPNESLTWHIWRYTGTITAITRVYLVYTPTVGLTWHNWWCTGTIAVITRVYLEYKKPQ